jgi:hypothetical protein
LKEAAKRPRCRWEDNITNDFQEIGWIGMDWIYMAQNKKIMPTLVKEIKNFGF